MGCGVPLLKSSYAAITAAHEDSVVITFTFSKGLTLGLAHRRKEARRRVTKLIRRADPLDIRKSDDQIAATFSRRAVGKLDKTLQEIDVQLDALTREKLHPALVEELLGITSRERIRWTKDGRLQKSGFGSFSRGAQPIGFALYRPSEIVELARNPHIIQGWRNADAAENCPQLTGG